MTTDLQIIPAQPDPRNQYAAIISLVLDAVDSPHTRRAYDRALVEFFQWYAQQPEPKSLSRAIVQRYRSTLQARGLAASTINQRISAIRKLADEAAANGFLDQQSAGGIKAVKGIRQEGKRAGNWLSREQAQALLDQPGTTTAKGLRDRAILAVLLGCGLRRTECTSLTWRHIQTRDGQPVIVDLIGKRNKVRSVPIPDFTHAALEAWRGALGSPQPADRVFMAIDRHGNQGRALTSQALYNIVNEYAGRLGLEFHPHDLRRTFAKLSLKGNADIKQIQHSLGHASVATTEIYLGATQDLTTAPANFIGLH